MKEIKCLDCDKTFTGKNPKEVMEKMHPHYMSEHQDVMEDGNEEKKQAWMKKFHEDWETAKEIKAS